MKHKASLTLLNASVLLGIVTLLLWWQSYKAARYVIGYWSSGEQTRSISVGIEPGQVAFASIARALNNQHGITLLVRHGQIPDSMAWADERGQAEFLGFRFYGVTYTEHMINPRHETIFDIPAWFFVALFAYLGGAAVYRMRRPPLAGSPGDRAT